jgi:hypothetical protein
MYNNTCQAQFSPDEHAKHRRLEKWMTFDRDLHVWVEVLEDMGADTASMQELFLLAQRDYDAANDVLSKLLKFQTTGHGIGNPSAWLHSAVLNIRIAIWKREWGNH